MADNKITAVPETERYSTIMDATTTIGAIKLADKDDAIALFDASIQEAYHAGIIRGIDIARDVLKTTPADTTKKGGPEVRGSGLITLASVAMAAQADRNPGRLQ